MRPKGKLCIYSGGAICCRSIERVFIQIYPLYELHYTSIVKVHSFFSSFIFGRRTKRISGVAGTGYLRKLINVRYLFR
jgi:hypothetical protein